MEAERRVPCGTEVAERRTRADWMARLKEAKADLIAAETEWKLALLEPPQTNDDKIVRDLKRQKVKWRRREYSWLLTHALRCGVLDDEDYHSATGELPVNSLGWP